MVEIGFEVVRNLGALAPAEQIQLLSSTSVVAGPHGAALSMSVFMQPGSLVIEFVDRDRPIDAFEKLAFFCCLRYLAVDGSSVDDSTSKVAEAIRQMGE